MISGLLDVLRSCTNLIAILRLNVADGLVGIEAITDIGKVLLHEVDVLVVVSHVHTRVANQQDAIPMETFHDLLALKKTCLGGAIFACCSQICIHIDDRDLISHDLRSLRAGLLTSLLRGGLGGGRSHLLLVARHEKSEAHHGHYLKGY